MKFNILLLNELSFIDTIHSYFGKGVDYIFNDFSLDHPEATRGESRGQVFLNNHRVLQIGPFKFLIDKQDNDTLLKKYDKVLISNQTDYAIKAQQNSNELSSNFKNVHRYTQNDFLFDVCKLLKSKYNYNINEIEKAINNNEIRLPNRTFDLYMANGIDSSRNQYRGNLSIPIYYMSKVISGPLSAIPAMADTANTASNIISKGLESSSDNKFNICIRNIKFKTSDPNQYENVYTIIKNMKELGLLNSDTINKLKSVEKNPVYMHNDGTLFTEKEVKKAKQPKAVIKDVNKVDLPNTKVVGGDIISGASQSSSSRINKLVDDFLIKFNLKEKLGWFGQSTAHLSVGVLGTLLIGLGLYKAAKAFIAWKNGKKDLAIKLMKEETNLPKTKEEALKLKEKIRNK